MEPRFGTLDDLQALQQGLARRGLGLVVDLVWNHTGYDSPLLAEHPEWFHRAPSISNWDDPIEREEGQEIGRAHV